MIDFHEEGCIYDGKRGRRLANCPCWLVFEQGQPGVVNQAATLALEGKLRRAFAQGYEQARQDGWDGNFDKDMDPEDLERMEVPEPLYCSCGGTRQLPMGWTACGIYTTDADGGNTSHWLSPHKCEKRQA